MPPFIIKDVVVIIQPQNEWDIARSELARDSSIHSIRRALMLTADRVRVEFTGRPMLDTVLRSCNSFFQDEFFKNLSAIGLQDYELKQYLGCVFVTWHESSKTFSVNVMGKLQSELQELIQKEDQAESILDS